MRIENHEGLIFPTNLAFEAKTTFLGQNKIIPQIYNQVQFLSTKYV